MCAKERETKRDMERKAKGERERRRKDRKRENGIDLSTCIGRTGVQLPQLKLG